MTRLLLTLYLLAAPLCAYWFVAGTDIAFAGTVGGFFVLAAMWGMGVMVVGKKGMKR